MSDKEAAIILGAGVGGLAAGYFLARTGNYQVTVLERAPVIGGMCASFEQEEFMLDYGAHKFYSVIPGILDEIRALMGDRLVKLPKKNRLFLRNHLVDYPLRLGNLTQVLGLAVFARLGLGYAVSVARGLVDRQPAKSYEAYMVKRFGRPSYELVFEPLADKVWGNPAELHPDMARTRVPASGGLEVILKLLGLKKDTAETNAEFFHYPQRGFGDFPQALREQIESMGGRVVVNAAVTGLELGNGRVTAVTGSADGQPLRLASDLLVSSIPLPVLGRLILSDRDPEFNRAVETLQFRHAVLVYLFIDRPLILEDQWIFFPEREFVFSRIFEQKQMNPELGPGDRTAICCDFTCTEDSWHWQATDEELAGQCIAGLVEGGFIQASDVIGHLVKRQGDFYPRYDLQYAEKMQIVSAKLKQVDNLLLTGRIGMYNYNNSDHCVDMGRFIAENLVKGQSPRHIWERLESRVRNYKIVD